MLWLTSTLSTLSRLISKVRRLMKPVLWTTRMLVTSVSVIQRWNHAVAVQYKATRPATLPGQSSDAVQKLTYGITALRATESTLLGPWYLSCLAWAHATLRRHDEAWRCIGDAIAMMETNKQQWCEAEVHRAAGEIALISPERDAAEAEASFERALAIARKQQAKSWELRAAMSMARLWRDQGKRQQARDLLAPVYGWFTEGFDTLDLKEAKALLDELHT